jgi:hypothetical protein
MMAKLDKFFLMPQAERRLFLKAGFLLVVMRLGLWLLPFLSLMRLAGRLGRTQNVRQTNPRFSEKIVWAVNAASPYVPGGTCLTRALVAQIMLKNSGFPADLRIGVAKDENGRFQSHAWIVNNGRVIIGGPEHENYVPFGDIGKFANLRGSCSLK